MPKWMFVLLISVHILYATKRNGSWKFSSKIGDLSVSFVSKDPLIISLNLPNGTSSLGPATKPFWRRQKLERTKKRRKRYLINGDIQTSSTPSTLRNKRCRRPEQFQQSRVSGTNLVTLPRLNQGKSLLPQQNQQQLGTKRAAVLQNLQSVREKHQQRLHEYHNRALERYRDQFNKIHQLSVGSYQKKLQTLQNVWGGLKTDHSGFGTVQGITSSDALNAVPPGISVPQTTYQLPVQIPTNLNVNDAFGQLRTDVAENNLDKSEGTFGLAGIDTLNSVQRGINAPETAYQYPTLQSNLNANDISSPFNVVIPSENNISLLESSKSASNLHEFNQEFERNGKSIPEVPTQNEKLSEGSFTQSVYKAAPIVVPEQPPKYHRENIDALVDTHIPQEQEYNYFARPAGTDLSQVSDNLNTHMASNAKNAIQVMPYKDDQSYKLNHFSFENNPGQLLMNRNDALNVEKMGSPTYLYNETPNVDVRENNAGLISSSDFSKIPLENEPLSPHHEINSPTIDSYHQSQPKFRNSEQIMESPQVNSDLNNILVPNAVNTIKPVPPNKDQNYELNQSNFKVIPGQFFLNGNGISDISKLAAPVKIYNEVQNIDLGMNTETGETLKMLSSDDLNNLPLDVTHTAVAYQINQPTNSVLSNGMNSVGKSKNDRFSTFGAESSKINLPLQNVMVSSANAKQVENRFPIHSDIGDVSLNQGIPAGAPLPSEPFRASIEGTFVNQPQSSSSFQNLNTFVVNENYLSGLSLPIPPTNTNSHHAVQKVNLVADGSAKNIPLQDTEELSHSVGSHPHLKTQQFQIETPSSLIPSEYGAYPVFKKTSDHIDDPTVFNKFPKTTDDWGKSQPSVGEVVPESPAESLHLETLGKYDNVKDPLVYHQYQPITDIHKPNSLLLPNPYNGDTQLKFNVLNGNHEEINFMPDPPQPLISVTEETHVREGGGGLTQLNDSQDFSSNTENNIEEQLKVPQYGNVLKEFKSALKNAWTNAEQRMQRENESGKYLENLQTRLLVERRKLKDGAPEAKALAGKYVPQVSTFEKHTFITPTITPQVEVKNTDDLMLSARDIPIAMVTDFPMLTPSITHRETHRLNDPFIEAKGNEMLREDNVKDPLVLHQYQPTTDINKPNSLLLPNPYNGDTQLKFNVLNENHEEINFMPDPPQPLISVTEETHVRESGDRLTQLNDSQDYSSNTENTMEGQLKVPQYGNVLKEFKSALQNAWTNAEQRMQRDNESGKYLENLQTRLPVERGKLKDGAPEAKAVAGKYVPQVSTFEKYTFITPTITPQAEVKKTDDLMISARDIPIAMVTDFPMLTPSITHRETHSLNDPFIEAKGNEMLREDNVKDPLVLHQYQPTTDINKPNSLLLPNPYNGDTQLKFNVLSETHEENNFMPDPPQPLISVPEAIHLRESGDGLTQLNDSQDFSSKTENNMEGQLKVPQYGNVLNEFKRALKNAWTNAEQRIQRDNESGKYLENLQASLEHGKLEDGTPEAKALAGKYVPQVSTFEKHTLISPITTEAEVINTNVLMVSARDIPIAMVTDFPMLIPSITHKETHRLNNPFIEAKGIEMLREEADEGSENGSFFLVTTNQTPSKVDKTLSVNLDVPIRTNRARINDDNEDSSILRGPNNSRIESYAMPAYVSEVSQDPSLPSSLVDILADTKQGRSQLENIPLGDLNDIPGETFQSGKNVENISVQNSHNLRQYAVTESHEKLEKFFNRLILEDLKQAGEVISSEKEDISRSAPYVSANNELDVDDSRISTVDNVGESFPIPTFIGEEEATNDDKESGKSLHLLRADTPPSPLRALEGQIDNGFFSVNELPTDTAEGSKMIGGEMFSGSKASEEISDLPESPLPLIWNPVEDERNIEDAFEKNGSKRGERYNTNEETKPPVPAFGHSLKLLRENIEKVWNNTGRSPEELTVNNTLPIQRYSVFDENDTGSPKNIDEVGSYPILVDGNELISIPEPLIGFRDNSMTSRNQELSAKAKIDMEALKEKLAASKEKLAKKILQTKDQNKLITNPIFQRRTNDNPVSKLKNEVSPQQLYKPTIKHMSNAKVSGADNGIHTDSPSNYPQIDYKDIPGYIFNIDDEDIDHYAFLSKSAEESNWRHPEHFEEFEDSDEYLDGENVPLSWVPEIVPFFGVNKDNSTQDKSAGVITSIKPDQNFKSDGQNTRETSALTPNTQQKGFPKTAEHPNGTIYEKTEEVKKYIIQGNEESSRGEQVKDRVITFGDDGVDAKKVKNENHNKLLLVRAPFSDQYNQAPILPQNWPYFVPPVKMENEPRSYAPRPSSIVIGPDGSKYILLPPFPINNKERTKLTTSRIGGIRKEDLLEGNPVASCPCSAKHTDSLQVMKQKFGESSMAREPPLKELLKEKVRERALKWSAMKQSGPTRKSCACSESISHLSPVGDQLKLMRGSGPKSSCACGNPSAQDEVGCSNDKLSAPSRAREEVDKYDIISNFIKWLQDHSKATEPLKHSKKL